MKVNTNRRKRNVAAVAMLMAGALVLAACGGSSSDGKDKEAKAGSDAPLKIILQPAANGLPVLIAKSQGIFAKHGVKVATIDHQATGQLYPALVAKRQYDIADLTPPTLFLAAASNLDIVAIANEFDVSKDFPLEYLMVPKDSPIKSIKDLKGKTVGTVSLTGNLWISFQNAVKQAGMDLSSVKPVQVPLPNMADQLAAKRVDAVLAIAPFSDTIAAAGNKVIDQPYLSIGPVVTGQIFGANRAWANSHKELIKKFIASLDEAATFIKANPDVAATELSKFTGVSVDQAKTTKLPPFSFNLDVDRLAEWQKVMQSVAPNPKVGELDVKDLVLDLS